MYTHKLITAIIFCLFFFSQNVQGQASFTLPKIAYPYNSLEPYIDSATMFIHHTKHHQSYVDNLNKALVGDTNNRGLLDMLKNISSYSTAVRNNAGGHYNHSLFWTILTPYSGTTPSPSFYKAIIQQFGSIEEMKNTFNQAAMKQFGSGWTWLIVDKDNKLMITSTPNQDNPLMDVVDKRGTPLIGIDVWEHAYYLRYQNKRSDYLAAIWNVINWSEVSRRYHSVMTIEE